MLPILLLVGLSSALSPSSRVIEDVPSKIHECRSVLRNAGASRHFGGNVAQGLRGLTLAQLRKFAPGIGKDNGVPTLHGSTILDSAPDFRGPDSFKFATEGMRTLDLVLSKGGWESGLERLIAAIQQQELWARARSVFGHLNRNAPPEEDVCLCARDDSATGVAAHLRHLAKGAQAKPLHYKRSNPKTSRNGKPSEMTKKRKEEYKADKQISSVADWKKWKSPGSPPQYLDLALYLYCALN